MNKKLISILIANLFVAAPVFAQDAFKLEGSVSIGGTRTDDGDAVDASKLNEYRDLSNGGLFAFDLRGRSNRYWLDLFGENLGRDDHYVNLRGGVYDVVKYRLYSDQLRHNFLFGGRTPYAGAGSVAVTASGFPLLDSATWNSVDVGYKRRDDGGFVEFQGANPWYFRVDGNQVTQSGSKVGSSSQGMSPGNGYVDLVFPTEYSTRNASVEGGYNTKKMHFAVSWMTSKFENDNESITWTNGFWGSGMDRTYLPPDNKYSRLAGNGTIRQLPLNSTLALRFTKDELKNDVSLANTVLGIAAGSPAGTAASQLANGANVGSFNGKVENDTFTLALASAPARNLDTRLYYNKAKRDDKSTHVVFLSAPVTASPYTNEPYSYDKSNWGFDAFYRINRQNRVGAGYDYLDIERERFDFDETKDKRWFVEWKTSMIENVSGRVKYTKLKRDSNFLLANDGANAQDVLYWNRFLQAFDAADLDQKSWKATIDFTPVDFLDVSLEGTIKDNKYTEMVLGRLSDKRQEVYGSVSYGNPDSARFTIFGSVENVKYESRHRVVGTASASGAYDPNTAPTATNYNWVGTNRDKNWSFGAAVDFAATEKLMLKASAVYYKTDGSLDFEAPPTIAAATYPQPVANYDDAKRTSLSLKGTYAFSKSISITAGYAYEKYDYKDAQFDGYRYTIPANNRADSYLLGYYANPQYKANIVYGLLTYRF